MADMHHPVTIDGVAADDTYAALTTAAGLTGWWTSRVEGSGSQPGGVLRMSFPDAPITWDMRVDKADAPKILAWTCVGGPPGWDQTAVTWAIEPTDGGVVVRFDHAGFPAVDDMFRAVTVGWSQMLLSLKAYLETGERRPFFDF